MERNEKKKCLFPFFFFIYERLLRALLRKLCNYVRNNYIVFSQFKLLHLVYTV